MAAKACGDCNGTGSQDNGAGGQTTCGHCGGAKVDPDFSHDSGNVTGYGDQHIK